MRSTERAFLNITLDLNHSHIRARITFFNEIEYMVTAWNMFSCSELPENLQPNIYWVCPEFMTEKKR